MDAGSRLRFRLEYALVKGALGAVGRLPPVLGRPLGRGLGRSLGALLAGRRRRALDNLRHAFPSTETSVLRGWVRGMWENLGEGFWESAHLARRTPEGFRSAVRLEGLEGLRASHAQGRGVILFAAHYGNWESITHAVALTGLPLSVIARRMKNPWVDELVNDQRGRFGARMIHHKNAARESIRWLKSGGILGMLFDQRIKDGGVAVPFFGRPALTTGLPALLALRLGVPLHGIRSDREKGKLVVRIGPALSFEGKPTPANIERVTAELTGVVEGWVRDHPERWLWIHNRWKQ